MFTSVIFSMTRSIAKPSIKETTHPKGGRRAGDAISGGVAYIVADLRDFVKSDLGGLKVTVVGGAG